MSGEDDVTAAELALGLIEGEERAAALRRVLAEPAFAAAVETWRQRFAQLFDLWPEATPPPELIDRIDRSLTGAVLPRARRFPWPLLAIASSALAASLLVVVTTRPDPPAPPPVVVAEGPALVAGIAAREQVVGALYRPATGTLRISAASLAPAGRVAELWVIAGDAAPYPLGLLTREVTEIHLTPADRARIAAGATLAISIEPPGGSPTGQPTGPVVGTGALSAL
jgi:anti-sigma-K factor RskA